MFHEAAQMLPLLLVIGGVILMLLEAMAPGAHFIVLGVALLIAGLLGLAISPLAGPVALAAMVLIAGAASFYVYREFDFYGGKGSGRTSDSDSLKGQSGRVTERVTATSGQVKLEDGGFNPYYQARAFDEDIPEGEEVIVVDPGGGNVLTVDSMAGLDDDAIDRELARERETAASSDTNADTNVERETASPDEPSADDDEERDVETEEAG
jgi:membrane protein implicated in regulation of membrane protease activity